LADAGKGDWVLCQITSNPYADARAVQLAEEDFVEGGLQRISYARPGKLFTAHESLFQRIAGSLTEQPCARVVAAIVDLLQVPTAGE
jgi:mRNA interferase MazF